MHSVGSFVFLPDGVLSASHFRLRVCDFRSQASASRLAGHMFNPSSEMASEMRTLAPKWEAAYRQKNRTPPCMFRIRDLVNPREKDLVLVNYSARRHKLVLMCVRAYAARAFASRLADLRALAPIGARGQVAPSALPRGAPAAPPYPTPPQPRRPAPVQRGAPQNAAHPSR